MELLVMILLFPVELPALGTDRARSTQIDQDVWLGDLLPHAWHIRMLLGNMTAEVSHRFKLRDQRGFAGPAGPDHADKRSTPGSCSVDRRSRTWRLHY